jgi:hypothetical protein
MPAPPPVPPLVRSRVPTKPPPAMVPSPDADAVLEQELDASIDAIARTSPPAKSTPPQLSSEGALESFDEIAAIHLRPLRELMMELQSGSAPVAWIGFSTAALDIVRRFAQELSHAALLEPVDELLETLATIHVKGVRTIEGADKEALQRAYTALNDRLPALGSLDHELNRREPIIVRSLLEQVPGVYSPTLEKLAGAGVMSLSRLLTANAEELTQTSGIHINLARRIVDKFTQYKRAHPSTSASADTQDELMRLGGLCEELRRLHIEHERAAEGWTPSAITKKRAMRAERSIVMLQIHVVLARMGEVECIGQLERCSFERKIDELGAYLARASSTRN